MSASVFPARAGMSRQVGKSQPDSSGVPRASGDEPLVGAVVMNASLCSPRERG